MRRGQLPEAPNYTTAALVMGGVNLFWIFLVLWAAFGLPLILAIAFLIDRVLTAWGARGA